MSQSLTVYVMVRLCFCYTSVLCQYGRGCHQVLNTGLQWKDSFFLEPGMKLTSLSDLPYKDVLSGRGKEK